jgi:hypothetical protein
MRHSRIEQALVLVESDDGSVARVRPVRVLTSPEDDILLVCPFRLHARRVWIKWLSPGFDRKFRECRIHHSTDGEADAAEYYYGLQVVGFGEWSMLTNHLQQTLLRGCTLRPSTLQPEPVSTPSRRTEQSLVPLLSAIGLVVVYATNLTW